MALSVKAGGGENVKPEVTTYETLLETAIANLAGKAFKPTQSKTVTPTAAGLTVTPDEGQSLGEVIISGDADLIPENIREGIDIFGVLGTMSEGVSGIDFGEVTLTSEQRSITVSHSLKQKPTKFGIICVGGEAGVVYPYAVLYPSPRNPAASVGICFVGGSTSAAYDFTANSANASSITFTPSDSYNFGKLTYFWYCAI